MSKFKPLTLGTLPRVFVNILAISDEEIVAFAETVQANAEMKSWIELSKVFPLMIVKNDDSSESFELRIRQGLSKFFLALLNLSKVTRSFFVNDFDWLLNSLGQQDFFGTEGQCDTRGDRRDELKYGR